MVLNLPSLVARAARRAAAPAALLLSLAACETLPEPACPAAAPEGWEGAGHQDGAAGLGDDRFALRVAECAKAGAPRRLTLAEMEARYLSGLGAGRTAYCAPAAALETGRRGRRLRPVCPADSMALNAGGLEEYWLLLELRDVRADVYSDRHRRFGWSLGWGRIIAAEQVWRARAAANAALLREVEAARAAADAAGADASDGAADGTGTAPR